MVCLRWPYPFFQRLSCKNFTCSILEYFAPCLLDELETFYVFRGIKDLFSDRPSYAKFAEFLLSSERKLLSIVGTIKRSKFHELFSWKNKKSDWNFP